MHKQVVQFKRYKLKKTWDKKIKTIVGRLVLFFIALGIVIWLGTQLYYFCVFHAIRTIPAELGELTESTAAKAVLLMNENVVRLSLIHIWTAEKDHQRAFLSWRFGG